MDPLKLAYEAGVKLAMQEAGLIKQGNIFEGDQGGSAAWPALLGGVGGAIAAPKGKGWQGFGGAMGGGALGGLGGQMYGSVKGYHAATGTHG